MIERPIFHRNYDDVIDRSWSDYVRECGISAAEGCYSRNCCSTRDKIAARDRVGFVQSLMALDSVRLVGCLELFNLILCQLEVDSFHRRFEMTHLCCTDDWRSYARFR